MNMNKFLILSSVLLAGVVACGDDTETGSGGGGGEGPTTTTTSGTTNPTTTSSTGGQGGDGQGGGTGGDGQGGQGGEGGSGPPAAPELGEQLERMGRPGINTATVDTFIVVGDAGIAPSDDATRSDSEDAYNAAANGSADAQAFITTQAAQLTVLDSLDGTCGNQPLWGFGADEGDCDDSVTGQPLVCYGTLATVLNDDQLWVKTTYDSCGIYLGVEADAAASLGSAQLPANEDCGGRRPVDDVINTTYSVVSGLVGGDPLFAFDDGITAPADLHPDTFPYLADPAE